MGYCQHSLSCKMSWVQNWKTKYYWHYDLPIKRRTLHCRLTTWLLYYIYDTIFLPCTNFRECSGLNIWHGFVFANEKDDKICKTGKFHTQKYCNMRKRISILSGWDTSSAPELVSKATFTPTFQFWSPPQYPPSSWRLVPNSP